MKTSTKDKRNGMRKRLENMKYLDLSIRMLEERVKELDNSLMSVKGSGGYGMKPKGGEEITDKMAHRIVEIIDLKNEYLNEIQDYKSIKSETLKLIKSVENMELRYILELKYIYNLSNKEIMFKMNISRVTVDKKIKYAIDDVIFTKVDESR